MVVALALPASGLARNIQTAALNGAVDPLNSCPTRSLLLNFDVYRGGQAVRQVPIWRLQNDAAFFFTSSLMIDADGAPNAYNPEDTGLDDLSNAGQPGHWDGIIADEEGNPVVQGPDDPFPGYYISCTALSDWTKERIDPTRYVDASKIPYIALPARVGPRVGRAVGRFGGCGEYAKRQVRVRNFRGHRAGSARVRSRLRTIWEFGRMRAAAGDGAAFCTWCFQDRASIDRCHLKRSRSGRKRYSTIGAASNTSVPVRTAHPRTHRSGLNRAR